MDLDLWDCFGRKKTLSFNRRNKVDPSHKTDLDFWACFGRGKPPSYRRRNMVGHRGLLRSSSGHIHSFILNFHVALKVQGKTRMVVHGQLVEPSRLFA